VALAWVLRPEGATAAICGARTPAQVREDAAAAGLLLPEDIDLATIRR
jgi:aryl-alcohol dehydrogenase-like predicted oxidoreductase